MKTRLCFLAAMSLAAVAIADDDGYTLSTHSGHIFVAEVYEQSGVIVVDLEFFKEPTPDKAMEYLKIQMAVTARLTGAKDNMLGYVYWRKDHETERQIGMPDGARGMTLKAGQYLTTKAAGMIGG